jgi:2-amino-4-hydroxy-6-hydroxymethyldihydropteridine diphosphokinase
VQTGGRAPGPAYLGLGANLGDREAAVLGAARALEASGIGCRVRLSSLYETEPVGCAPMDWFVNAVVEFEPLLCPADLLKRLQTIEKLAGRRGGHNEPRELDIDIIALGTAVIDAPDLVVPHPRFRERAFVLVPLQELAPRFECPATRRDIGKLLAAVAPCRGVSRISTRKTLSV